MKLVSTVVAGILLWFTALPALPAEARPLAVCADASGHLTARRKCPPGAALSGAVVSQLLATQILPGAKGEKGPKGEIGDRGLPGVADIVISDGTPLLVLPGCDPDPNNFPFCISSIPVMTSAVCPSGTRGIRALCVDRETGGALVVRIGSLSADGGGSCTHQNQMPFSRVGAFYTRLVCMPRPPV